MELNGREAASLFWLLVVATFVVARRDTRAALPSILRLLFGKIGLALGGLLIYTAGFVTASTRLGLWSSDLLKPTVIWFLSTAMVLFFNLNKAMEQRGFFRGAALRTLELSVLVQFVVDLFPFSFWVEVPLQAIVFLLGVLPLVEKSNGPASARMSSASRSVLGTLGVGLLVASIVKLAHLWRELSLVGLLQQFALPVWATLALLPFVYVMALAASYGSAFSQMRAVAGSDPAPWHARLALMLRARLRIARVHSARGLIAMAMARGTSLRESLAAYDQGQAERRREVEEDAAAAARLDRYAGVAGVDECGQQLDRREFEGTRDALRWVASCHMGHHHNLGLYRDDLLPILLVGDTFSRYGLPADPGVVMHVDSQGARWWAWRRTITGWVFGVGANSVPPDQWTYDGPEPPTGPPGEGGGWRHFMDPREGGNWD